MLLEQAGSDQDLLGALQASPAMPVDLADAHPAIDRSLTNLGRQGMRRTYLRSHLRGIDLPRVKLQVLAPGRCVLWSYPGLVDSL